MVESFFVAVSVISFLEESSKALTAAIESAVAAAFAESESAADVVAVSLHDVIIAATTKIAINFFILINLGYEFSVQNYYFFNKTIIFHICYR